MPISVKEMPPLVTDEQGAIACHLYYSSPKAVAAA
jgi:hypothetical protein